MIAENDSSNRGMQLFTGGALFTAIIVMWPILMVLSQNEGGVQEQLLALSEQPGIYMLNFFIASLIAPAIAFLLIMLAFRIETTIKTPTLDIFGGVFIAPYAAFVSFSYTSQYTVLQSFLRREDFIQAELWYFENFGSVPYFVNQLGYVFFGLSGLLIGYKFLREQGVPRAIGVLLWLSGILSFVAFAGLALGSELMNFSSIISGLLTLPIGILVMVWGMRIKRTEGKRLQNIVTLSGIDKN